MAKVAWLTYDVNRSARLFGDQVFINSMFEELGFEQQEGLDGLQGKGAIAVIQLDYCKEHIDEINDDLSRLDWVLLICTTNELGEDFYKQIQPDNTRMIVWLQTPKKFDFSSRNPIRYFPFGAPSKLELDIFSAERVNDWFFAGQVNHPRREQCVKVLKTLPNGKLVESTGFNQGLPHDQYIQGLLESKVVPCPGGPQTPDTFRVYEALEAGCIPVLDRRSGLVDHKGFYWSRVFGDHQFTEIEDWNDFPAALKFELDNWEERSTFIRSWWSAYKKDLRNHLMEDLIYLEESL